MGRISSINGSSPSPKLGYQEDRVERVSQAFFEKSQRNHVKESKKIRKKSKIWEISYLSKFIHQSMDERHKRLQFLYKRISDDISTVSVNSRNTPFLEGKVTIFSNPSPRFNVDVK